MRRGGGPPSNVETANRLIEVMARKYFAALGGSVEMAELRSLSARGAAEALRKWDGRGYFDAFALQRIRWAILRGLRREVLRGQESRAREETCALVAAERAADALAPSPGGASGVATLQVLADETLWSYRLELAYADEAVEVADPAQDVERDVDRMRLRRTIPSLPPPEDAVLHRYCYEGETFEEIAEGLGMSRSGVHEAHRRGVRRLVETLGPKPTDEQRRR